MSRRWQRLNELFSVQDKFLLAGTGGFVVAWVKCNFELGNYTCADFFNRGGLGVNDGRDYGDTKQFVRFNMQSSESTFELLYVYLSRLLQFDFKYKYNKTLPAPFSS